MRGSLASLDALPGSTVLDTTDQEDIVESEDRSHMTLYTSHYTRDTSRVTHLTRDTCNYRRTIASEEFDMKLREVVVSHDGWVSRNDKVFNYIQVSLHLSLSCLAGIQIKSCVQQELIIKDRVKGRNNGRNDLVSVLFVTFCPHETIALFPRTASWTATGRPPPTTARRT